jgi:hypothetical protein
MSLREGNKFDEADHAVLKSGMFICAEFNYWHKALKREEEFFACVSLIMISGRKA